MTGLAALLIFVGLFLAGGTISFWKQQLPKGVIVLLAVASVMCLAAGILRVDWWA
ncbi:hypothetical protein [Streptomyces sp. WMMB303]|uniref:hypothetical protein n=1 Tax=Streptomyces sp. WMMB303 TaxID=3034154 RepID=UPI0023EC1E4A|nr:hypothetical protein [Streptomyces sp. WMMB303]MDF4250075.1 hypothetical protein [Streptomyces sp. WMMB303]